MCYKGSEIEYKRERAADLIRAYREHLLHTPFIVEKKIWRIIANSPSRRFWVSLPQAYLVISKMLKGEMPPIKNPHRRRMYEEIHRRVTKKTSLGVPLFSAVNTTIHEKAPSFYLSSSYVRSCIFQYKKRKRTTAKNSPS